MRLRIRPSHRLRLPALTVGVLLVGLFVLSCGHELVTPTAPPITVASISLSGMPIDGLLLTGQSVNLVAAVRDASGNPLQGRTVTWSSSNASVAAVSPSGVVNAAAIGVVTIAATAEGRSATADLTVRVAIATPPAGAVREMTTSILGGSVTITIPPDAVAAGARLNAAPADAAVIPSSGQLLPNSAFVFGPDGTQFAKPLLLSLLFDTSGVTPLERAGLAIYLAKNGAWEEVPGSMVSGNHVLAPITHFSTYGVLRRLPPARMFISKGDGQTALAGTTLPIRPLVTVVDARGHAVAHVPVQFSIARGGGVLTGASPLTDDDGGAAVGSWTLGPVAGVNSVVASVSGVSPLTLVATATAPTPVELPPSSVKLVSQPDLVLDGVPFPSPIVADLVDSTGARVASAHAPVTISQTSGPGTLSGTTTVQAVNGRVTFSDLRLAGMGDHWLLLASPGLYNASARVLAMPSAAKQLVVRTQPRGAAMFVPFVTQPVVEITDATGRRVSGATNAVTVVDYGDPLAVSGTRVATAVDGVATFTDLQSTTSGRRRLLFLADNADVGAVISDAFSVASEAVMLVLPSASTRSGLVLSPAPVVELHDYNGDHTPSSGNTALVTASVSGGTGTLAGPTTVGAVNGVATFSNLKVLGTGYHQLMFSVGSRLAVGFASMIVSPAVPQIPARLVVTRQPATATSGQSFLDITVELQDSTGSHIIGDVHPVTVAVASGNGALTGTTTVSSDANGNARFLDFKIGGWGPQTLVFSTGGASGKSAPITLTQRVRALVLATQPAGTRSGVVLTTQPVAKIIDDADLPVAGATTPVTVRVPGNRVALSGPTTVDAVDGVATFSGLKVIGGFDFTLQFDLPSGLTARSNLLRLLQTATHLGVAVQPGQATSGFGLVRPQIEVLDADGARVAFASSLVTASVKSGNAAILAGATSTAPVGGVASFPLMLLGGAGPFTLEFTSPAVASVTSASSILTQLVRQGVFATQPGGATSGVPFTVQPVVEIRDHANLPYAVSGIPVTVFIASGTGTLAGTTVVNTVNGVARFTDLRIIGSGPFTLGITIPNAASTSPPSATFSVAP